MADAPLIPSPPGVLPPGIVRKDASVILDGVNPVLITFLQCLGFIHLQLFGGPCVLTSAKDSKHANGSKHYRGDAVDLRITDKDGLAQAVFLLILVYLSRRFLLAVFDESCVLGAGHVHVEIAG